MLHRKFAQSYIPKFKDAVTSYFDRASDVEIRKIQKDRFDRILLNLENIIQRVYTVLEKYKILEHFELNMYTLFIKSNYLQLRIDGLKGINDFCKMSTKGLTRSISDARLTKWIEKKKIVDELFGSRKHQQILQRAAPLLRFINSKSGLSQETLERLWELTKDEQLRQDLFRVVCEIGFLLPSRELEFFANKISSMSPADITEEALDVIYAAYRNPNKTTEQLLKYANLIADIAFNEKYSLPISEKALDKYAEMVSPLEYDPYKKEIILKCINEMIGKNRNSVLALKLIKKFLHQCMGASIIGFANTRAAAIDALITEANLLDVFFANFERYYAVAKESKTKDIVIDRHTHSENVRERVDFLGYLLTNCTATYRLPIQYYYKLWAILYESPVSSDDSQILFTFLKFIASDSASVFFHY